MKYLKLFENTNYPLKPGYVYHYIGENNYVLYLGDVGGTYSDLLLIFNLNYNNYDFLYVKRLLYIC